MPVIDQYFQYLVDSGASDLHLSEGQPPKMRTHGSVAPIAEGILEHDLSMVVRAERPPGSAQS